MTLKIDKSWHITYTLFLRRVLFGQHRTLCQCLCEGNIFLSARCLVDAANLVLGGYRKIWGSLWGLNVPVLCQMRIFTWENKTYSVHLNTYTHVKGLMTNNTQKIEKKKGGGEFHVCKFWAYNILLSVFVSLLHIHYIPIDLHKSHERNH